MSITAYFIGGPEDRTVRELPTAVPVYEVMVGPRIIHATARYQNDTEFVQVGPIGVYRRSGKLYYIKNTWVYEFEGYK